MFSFKYKKYIHIFILYNYFQMSSRRINCSLWSLQLKSDLDKEDSTFKYILTGEGAGSIFTINETTGVLHVIQKLDREKKALYTLRAQAINRNTQLPMEPESEFVIKVKDINDQRPQFLDGPYEATVPEMSPEGTECQEAGVIFYALEGIDII